MDYLEMYAQEKLAELKDLQAKCKRKLRNSMEGKIYARKNRKGSQFYLVKPSGNKNGEYIKAGDRKIAERLINKEYLENLLCEIEIEIKAIENMLSQYDSEKLENVINKMTPIKQGMVVPLILSQEDFIKNWEKEKSKQKEKLWDRVANSYDQILEKDEGVFTEKNEKVRSKSEKIIADKLRLMGVPYIYELPLEINQSSYIKPDFTALNPDTRKEFIWEHFGMMDDPVYASGAMSKLNMYARNGYIEGKNLIITMESKEQPLNTRNLEKIIRQNLLIM